MLINSYMNNISYNYYDNISIFRLFIDLRVKIG